MAPQSAETQVEQALARSPAAVGQQAQPLAILLTGILQQVMQQNQLLIQLVTRLAPKEQ